MNANQHYALSIIKRGQVVGFPKSQRARAFLYQNGKINQPRQFWVWAFMHLITGADKLLAMLAAERNPGDTVQQGDHYQPGTLGGTQFLPMGQ